MIGLFKRLLGHRDVNIAGHQTLATEVQEGRQELKGARARELLARSHSVKASIDGMEVSDAIEKMVRDAMREIEGRKNVR